jgi:hypothetical protein
MVYLLCRFFAHELVTITYAGVASSIVTQEFDDQWSVGGGIGLIEREAGPCKVVWQKITSFCVGTI